MKRKMKQAEMVSWIPSSMYTSEMYIKVVHMFRERHWKDILWYGRYDQIRMKKLINE